MPCAQARARAPWSAPDGIRLRAPGARCAPRARAPPRSRGPRRVIHTRCAVHPCSSVLPPCAAPLVGSPSSFRFEFEL